MSKNVKITSNNYDVELKINNSISKFNVKHKMDKKEKLLVTIKQDDKTYVLKLKETKNKIKVKGIEITVNGMTSDLSLDGIEFIDNFEIKVHGFYVPVTVLINPVLELYYDSKKIDTEMKANKAKVKMKKNKYTVDCSVRKEDYVVETSALSIEELKELYDEDENNRLGVYLEFLKRQHELEEETAQEMFDEMKDVIEESQDEIDKLNEKHKKEKEELNKKIQDKLNDKKEKMKYKEERVPLVDLLCSVFEDCGKKEIYMEAYEKGNDEIIKVIKDLIEEKPELKHIINKMLDIKIEQKDEVELAKFFKNAINSETKKEKKGRKIFGNKDKKEKKDRKLFNKRKSNIPTIENINEMNEFFKEVVNNML